MIVATSFFSSAIIQPRKQRLPVIALAPSGRKKERQRGEREEEEDVEEVGGGKQREGCSEE